MCMIKKAENVHIRNNAEKRCWNQKYKHEIEEGPHPSEIHTKKEGKKRN